VISETVIATVGEEFMVSLKSTPSTGYIWETFSLPEGIVLLGSDFEKPASNIQPGDPVIQLFRFRALTAGEYVISFVLKRTWESNAIESHEVAVKVI
jgi:predicted secreted protein